MLEILSIIGVKGIFSALGGLAALIFGLWVRRQVKARRQAELERDSLLTQEEMRQESATIEKEIKSAEGKIDAADAEDLAARLRRGGDN